MSPSCLSQSAEESTQLAREARVERAYYIFLRYLEQVRGRLTKPRLSVARWVMGIEEVFQDEDINYWIRQRGLPIGPRSVSTTLELLVKSGVVMRLTMNDQSYYLSLAGHAPDTICLLCVDCLSVRQTRLPNHATKRIHEVAESHDFATHCALRVVRGRCRDCQQAADPDIDNPTRDELL